VLEFLLCSAVTILPDYLFRRHVQGKRIGHEITLYSVWFELRWGIAACAILTLMLLTMIFYFHPMTTNVTSFFRTVTILPETSGRVAEVLVSNEEHVEVGQPLFRLDDADARSAVATAESRVAEIAAAGDVALARLAAAEGAVEQARGALEEAREELAVRVDLRERNSTVVSEREIEALENAALSAQGALDASRANRDAVSAEIERVLPSQAATAQAALAEAQVTLDQTVVRAGTDGRVEQFALQPGDFVSPLMRPAGILVPTAPETRVFQAGFDQLAAQVVHEGMPVEVTCLTKPFDIVTMRVTEIQGEIAAGQFRPTDRLLDVSERTEPGLLTVQLTPIWPEEVADIPPGSACIGSGYTVPPHGSGLFMHAVGATGVVHAAGLRLRALFAPIQTLVLSGH
jgi:multidrug resistance efflux pump